MFKAINHFRAALRRSLTQPFLKNNISKNAKSNFFGSSSGQVAVILIVVISIALVLFAASVNYTLLSQSKTLTMKAATAGSSSMASMLASYGERLFQEQLGGRSEVCYKSGGFGFLGLIIMIVIAIFAPEILGVFMEVVTPAAVASLQTAAIVGAVMEGVSILIAASSEPNLADMWNRMQNANLSQTGQFVERGIQTALQNVVTDQVRIPDLYDLDQDGLFGFAGPGNTNPRDTISRFSLYNTKRFLNLPPANTAFVENFLDALHELVLKGSDNWGLWDPVFYPAAPTHASTANPSHNCFIPLGSASAGNIPAECDICCQYFPGDIPAFCFPAGSVGNPGPTPVTQLGDRSTCASRSPFRAVGSGYPYIYDPAYEDSTNTFFSFREQLGRDDEHHLYHTTQANPNWHADPINGVQTLNTGLPDQGFFLKDNVGYYVNPGFGNLDLWVSPNPPGVNPPLLPKLYPFLYKMKDWAPQLSSASFNNYECHWCDSRKVADPGKTCPADLSLEIGRLDLGVGANPPALTYNQSWCVDIANSGVANAPPLLSDNVTGLPTDIFVDTNECAINPSPTPASDINQYMSFAIGHNGWKAGSDRYCSPLEPYNFDCPKHGVPLGTPANDPLRDQANKQCGEAGAGPASQWVDDLLDDMIYGGLPATFGLEAGLQQQRTAVGLLGLSKSVRDWYSAVADLIETPCPDPANCPGSVTKEARPGAMFIWRANLEYFNSRIQTWLKPPTGSEYVSPVPPNNCTGPSAVWCVPQPFNNGLECPAVTAAEAATFDANGNGQRGDLYDVVQCLNWNANDQLFMADNVTPYQIAGVNQYGNAAKFQRCRDLCVSSPSSPETAAACSNLPRSLVPAFYDGTQYISGRPAYEFVAGTSADTTLLNACLSLPASATIQQCVTNCNQPPLPSGSPYNLPAFNSPNANYSRFLSSGPGNDLYTFCQTNPTGTVSNACNIAYVPSGQLTCNTNFNECMCSWAGSCMGFGQCQAYCNAYGAGNACHDYFNAVTDAVPISGGSCSDPAYLNVMQQSANEAKVQVEKFKHRHKFLQGRFNEAMALSNETSLNLDPANTTEGVLTTGIKKITEFLDGGTDASTIDSPAEEFIDAVNTKMEEIAGDLPAFAIYVWQDSDPVRLNLAGQPKNEQDPGHGYWHAVKVETRLPRRCTGNCIAYEWPKVVSRQSGGGFFSGKKICYRLENREGMVKTRVIRYDQDKDLRGLVFPGGQQIWKSRLSNPNETSPADPTGLRTTCESLLDPDLNTWLRTVGDPNARLGAAFMLNQKPDIAAQGTPTPEGDYADCWVRVHQALISHGVQSEACANYYFAGDSEGFRVKFVPCDDWQ